MKILIQLTSRFYSAEQIQYCYNNRTEVEWDVPFLPRAEELFDCDSIIGEKMPIFCEGLSWHVSYISYERIKGKITPIICLCGE